LLQLPKSFEPSSVGVVEVALPQLCGFVTEYASVNDPRRRRAAVAAQHAMPFVAQHAMPFAQHDTWAA
jgi:hypothetical protein